MRYINKLEEEVRFLRDEVRSKGKIIDLLLENSVLRDSQNFPLQSRHINSTPQVSNFEFPKRKTNVKYNESSNTLLTKNRFDVLRSNNDQDGNQVQGSKIRTITAGPLDLFA